MGRGGGREFGPYLYVCLSNLLFEDKSFPSPNGGNPVVNKLVSVVVLYSLCNGSIEKKYLTIFKNSCARLTISFCKSLFVIDQMGLSLACLYGEKLLERKFGISFL